MKILTRLFLTLAAAAALSCATPAFANLVSNSGFETGDFTDWTQFGNTGFTGVDPFYAHTGGFGAAFGPIGSTGGIFQSLTTVASQTYNLTFWLRNDGFPINSFSASWNGVVIPASVLINAGPFGYTMFSFTGLLATGAATDLRFTFQHDPSFWGFDDVSVTAATPDGGNTLALLGLAMVGICLVRRWAPAGVR